MIYYDCHTHSKRSDTKNIYSIDIRKETHVDHPFSIGIHPWFIEKENLNAQFEILKKGIANSNCVALGEIGLDRTIDLNIETQKKVLEKQLELINEFKVNTIIFHCVKAFSDIEVYLKKLPKSITLIFHDYNGNEQITNSLLKYNTFFSYGEKLFNESTSGFKSLSIIPKDRILLESDEKYLIEEVYQKSNISHSQLEKNFLNAFKKF